MKPSIDILVPMSGKGGVETVLNDTATYLVECGYGVRVVQFVYNDMPWLNESVPFFPLSRKPVEDVFDFIEMYKIFLMESNIPDMILATPWPLLTVFARAALKALDGQAKILSWLHAPLETYEKYDTGGADCLKLADNNLVLTKRNLSLLNKAGISKATLIPNPTNLSKAVFFNRDFSTRRLLYVGRLSAEKNPALIIKALALAKNPEWSLTIKGAGEQYKELTALAENLGLSERVSFTGWQENPWEGVCDMAFLVVPSFYEGFSLVAVEAMACGLPVIATPVDGIIERIVPGENGFLFSMNSPRELADILDYLDNGTLSYPSSLSCLNTALPFKKENALKEIEQVIYDTFMEK